MSEQVPLIDDGVTDAHVVAQVLVNHAGPCETPIVKKLFHYYESRGYSRERLNRIVNDEIESHRWARYVLEYRASTR